MFRSDICIVIPAFNEEKTIGSVIQGLVDRYRVIVVDDCSNDRTQEISEAHGAIVERSAVNVGYDGALNIGFRKALELGTSYLITADADGQHSQEAIVNCADLLLDGHTLVLGVRDGMQRYGERLFSFITKKIGVSDPLCGLKGYGRLAFRDKKSFDSYNSIGTDLLFYAISQGNKPYQFNITMKARADRPRFGSGVSANKKIVKAMLLSIWRYKALFFRKSLLE